MRQSLKSALKQWLTKNRFFQAAFQTSKLVLAAFVGSYLLSIISVAVVVETLLIPNAILIAELLWTLARKRFKKPPVTGFGKLLVKFAGWIVEGASAGVFFSVGFTLIIYIPRVDNVAYAFLGFVGLVSIFLIVTFEIFAVKIVEDVLAFIDHSTSPDQTTVTRKKRFTYRQHLRLLFYTVLGVSLYYVIGPVLLGTNAIIATLSLTATSLALLTLSIIIPELKKLPEQVDPTGEGQNWADER